MKAGGGVAHFTWWPGLLAILDADGNRIGTFVNSGWIRGIDASPDGQHLLMAGVTNSRDSYFFAVLDAAAPSGRSPEPPGSPTECLSCPDGDPQQYIVFPRTDVSRHQPFPAAGPTVITATEGTIHVHALSSGSPNIADTIYEFTRAGAGDSPYVLRGVRFSDSHWEWHRRLERDGRLDHAAAACPHRQGLDVRRWLPGSGWHSVRVAVR